MLSCPDQLVLADYASGKLSAPLADSLDEHISGCSDCQERLSSLGGLSDPLLVTLRQAPRDDGFSQEPECQQGLLIAAQAAFRRRPLSTDCELLRLPEVLRDYRILEPLGRGGMGSVYRAVHTRLHKEVALKIISPERRHSPAAARRFEQEMKAVGRLDHPNVVRATDAGEEGGLAYLAMELVSGIDLAALVRRSGPLPIAAACELARQAAEGLAYIHDHSLVHRDIKPANLMLTPQGTVKMLDLGLALLNDPQGGPATGTSNVLGTADYLAPEQIDACHEVSAAADIYSLGCALYELLTGKPPFSGEPYATTTKKLLAHSQAPVPPVVERRPEVPAELAELVEQMLAKQPADRPQSGAEVARRLARFAATVDLPALVSAGEMASEPPPLQSDVATDTLSRAASTPGAALKKVTATEGLRTPSRRRLHLALAMGGIALLAAIVIVIRKGDAVRAIVRLEKDETLTIEDGDETFAAADIAPAAKSPDIPRVDRPMRAAPRNSPPAVLRGLLPHPATVDGLGQWQLHTLNPCGWVWSLCWSADGRWIGAGGNDLRLYEAESLRLARLVACHDFVISSLQLQEPDEPVGTSSHNGVLKLVDLRDGSTLSINAEYGGGPTGGWSPDRSFAASTGGNGGEVKLWNHDGSLAKVLGRHDAPADFHCWDRDSRKLITSDHVRTAKIWNVDGSPGVTLSNHEGRVRSACFSPDGWQIATGSNDGKVRLWSADGELQNVLTGHTHFVRAVAWSPDGDILASGGFGDFTVRFWKPDGTPGRIVNLPGWVSALAWSPDSKQLAVGTSAGLDILSRDGAPRWARHGHVSDAHAAAFSPAGDRLAVGCVDRVLRVWSPDGRMQLFEAQSGGAILNMSWHPNGNRLASADGNATATIWSLDDVGLSRRLQHPSDVHRVAWSRDGHRLATGGSDGQVTIWSEDGVRQSSFKAHDSRVHALDWNHDDSQLLTGSGEGARLWQPDGTGRRALTSDYIHGAALSPDGKLIATCPFLKLWSSDGELLFDIYSNHVKDDQAVCWSSDSSRLATAGMGPVGRIWRANGLRGGPDLIGAGGTDATICWNPSRPQIASTQSCSAIVWDANTGEPQWLAVVAGGHCFRFSGNGEPLGEFDEAAAENELVYQIASDNGHLELLSPSQFNARITAAREVEP